MTKHVLLIFALWLACFPALAAEAPIVVRPYALSVQDKAVLARVERYLSSLHTVRAEFIQASPNGDVSSGLFYLQRPGKLRMEYNPPVPVLMVASGGDVVYFDKELDQVSRISLESTLVGFLARDQVMFDDTVIITALKYSNASLRISLVQSRRPKDGALTLEFSDKPLIMRSMVVTDSSGQTTTVSIHNAQFNLPLDKALFIFKDPHLGGRRVKR